MLMHNPNLSLHRTTTYKVKAALVVVAVPVVRAEARAIVVAMTVVLVEAAIIAALVVKAKAKVIVEAK